MKKTKEKIEKADIRFSLPDIKKRLEIKREFRRTGSSQEDLNKAEKDLSKANKTYSVSINKGRTKVKIGDIPIHIKKISATSLLKSFASLDYDKVKEGKVYIPANDNRSLFFQEAWKKAQI